MLLGYDFVLIFWHIICLHWLHFICLVGNFCLHWLRPKFSSLFKISLLNSTFISYTIIIILSQILSSSFSFSHFWCCYTIRRNTIDNLWLAFTLWLLAIMIFNILILWVLTTLLLLNRTCVLIISPWWSSFTSLWYNFSVHLICISCICCYKWWKLVWVNHSANTLINVLSIEADAILR